jgi:signal transduction histidine kinase
MKVGVGRLFWRFFAWFWLAQVVTSIGVGMAIWMLRHDRSDPPRPPPPPLEAAANGPARDAPPGPNVVADGRSHHPRPWWSPPVLPIIAGGVVSLVFAGVLAWHVTRRIRILQRAFLGVADGRLETRVGAEMGRGQDELAALGRDFDRMAGRLQDVIEAQRRLLHDVSHELRSPLARQQAAIELIRQQPERISEFVDRIDRESQRVDALVGEILTLSRLEAGAGMGPKEQVDLVEVMAAIVDDARFEAVRGVDGAAALEIIFDHANPVLLVRGDANLIQRACENVVRNAIHHGRPNRGGARARVEIGVRCEADALCIDVADNGPGVPEADLGRLFDPFFRTGQGRARGHGLGLAITRRIVEAHGGVVEASNRTSGGLQVSIRLPVTGAGAA